MTLQTVSTTEKDLTKFARTINQLGAGRSNANGTFTLTPSPATSTVVAAPNCNTGNAVLLSPLTADAAAALATTYVSSVGKATFTITHLSNVQVDRTFAFVCLG